MNGLEAIRLMEQGKMVTSEYEATTYIFKIINNNVFFKRINDSDDEYQSDFAFDFSANYEEYIEPKPLTGWERVDKHEKYVSIALCQKTKCVEFEDEVDDEIYGIANYFSIEEKAEEINFKQTLFRKLQRFSDENGGNEIDWNDGEQRKWMIRFDHGVKRLYVVLNTDIQNFGQVYFVSKKITEQAIELFHDELIKYFTM